MKTKGMKIKVKLGRNSYTCTSAEPDCSMGLASLFRRGRQKLKQDSNRACKEPKICMNGKMPAQSVTAF